METKDDINLFLDQFNKVIYVDFGIDNLNDSIKNWYKLSWEEFRNELLKLKIKVSATLLQEWEFFFHHHKNKVLTVMK